MKNKEPWIRTRYGKACHDATEHIKLDLINGIEYDNPYWVDLDVKMNYIKNLLTEVIINSW